MSTTISNKLVPLLAAVHPDVLGIASSTRLIGKDGLNWDLSKLVVAEPGDGERQPVYTGTWQFLAARLLMAISEDSKPPTAELADDLESFYHVLSWVILCFTKHGLNSSALGSMMYFVYDYSIEHGRTPMGILTGMSKAGHIRSRFMRKWARLPQTALRDLVCDLEDVFTIQYEDKEPPLEEMIEWWKTKYNNASEERRRSMERCDDMGIIRKGKLNSTWMINRFVDAIKSNAPEDWPEGECMRVVNEIKPFRPMYVAPPIPY